MTASIIASARLTLAFALFFPGIYTFLVWAIAQGAPHAGKGETFVHEGKKYYLHIAQQFADSSYFWPRPSAVSYNAAGSGGSNKGPTNAQYLEEVEARINAFLAQNPDVERHQIPSELVTASGSGLDPHLSLPAAMIQIKRIAKARGLYEGAVKRIVDKHTQPPFLGLFGPSVVNVLQLNIALDEFSESIQ